MYMLLKVKKKLYLKNKIFIFYYFLNQFICTKKCVFLDAHANLSKRVFVKIITAICLGEKMCFHIFSLKRSYNLLFAVFAYT